MRKAFSSSFDIQATSSSRSVSHLGVLRLAGHSWRRSWGPGAPEASWEPLSQQGPEAGYV